MHYYAALHVEYTVIWMWWTQYLILWDGNSGMRLKQWIVIVLWLDKSIFNYNICMIGLLLFVVATTVVPHPSCHHGFTQTLSVLVSSSADCSAAHAQCRSIHHQYSTMCQYLNKKEANVRDVICRGSSCSMSQVWRHGSKLRWRLEAKHAWCTASGPKHW